MTRAGAAVCLVLGLAMVSGCGPAHLTLVAVANGEDGRPVAVLQPCDDEREVISWVRLESRPTGSSGAEGGGAGTDGPETGGTGTDGAGSRGTGTDGAETGGTETDGAGTRGTETRGAGTRGTETDGAETRGTETGGAGEGRVAGGDGGWESPRGMTHSGRAVFPVLSPPASWLVEEGGTRELLPGRTYSLSFYAYDGQYVGDGDFTADDLASLRPGELWAAGRAMSVDDFAEHVHAVC